MVATASDTHPAPAGTARWPERTHLELHDELHARPALPVRRPGVVSYWVHWGMDPAVAEAALAAACAACGGAAPQPGTRHHLLQTPAFALKYERHGEFVSWQANCPLPDPGEHCDDGVLQPMLHDARALDALPPAFAAALQAGPGCGHMLAATHLVLLRCQDEDLLPRSRAMLSSRLGGSQGDDSAPLLGSWIGDGKAAVLTDLRVRDDGFTRIALLDFGLPPDQAAREAQRLCEIEAYRMLAMLGFPVAQREAQSLADLERTLQQTVDAMANDAAHDDSRAFDTLTRLAAEVEHSAARTRYRFSATRAYHQIVQRRLADLRETRLEGMQTLSGFLARRFAPAMAFCESTDARLTDVADRINRAVSLARVRVEMHREANNQQLFQALAHRQKLQLRLQQTVEGLSVVAISYYLLGLVGYMAKAAKDVPALKGLQIQPELVVGLAVVPVVAGVKLFLNRLHKHLGND
ncbi:MAG: DUF3422 domain-containing protein [Pseudomonadota bacterium]